MTCILSVDLAYKHYASIGIVLLERTGGTLAARPLRPFAGQEDAPTSDRVAGELARLAEAAGAAAIILDGSQAWKDAGNGLAHARLSEKALHTPGKTGEPCCAKPGGYLPFFQFSVAVFDELDRLG